jgi:putative hydrolase of the HAD superfamily
MDTILFWDFDGTLSHPNKSFTSAFPLSLLERNYSLNDGEIAKFLDTFYSWKTPHIDYTNQTNELWWNIHFEKIRNFCANKNIPASDIDTICEIFRKKLIAVSNYRLYDDTVATLEACIHMGFRNYLITNNYPEILDNLKKLNIADYFSDFIVSSHIGYEKPRKEFFDYAKKVSGAASGYMIGDNPVADIQGGKDAGFVTIAVHACKQSCADHYVETLSQILPILG